ncbi:MAG: alpha/beta hydrolase [Acidiferrobacterales bacterium]|nr:alpha/beta hydrolase [Acidiferrobacterales bacterium]
MLANVGNIQIHYEISGNTRGPVVAVSHSLASSGIMWKTQLPLLEPDYLVIRIDTRGHGGSSAPDAQYAMDELVDDAVGLLDKLEIERFHWVGLSMGGMIGQGIGIRHPDRLLSLSLCDTMARVPQEMLPVWEKRVETSERFGMKSMVDPAMERWFTERYRNQPPTREFEEIRQQVLDTPLSGFIGCCHAIMNFNFLDDLKHVRTPTHIIVGDQDAATPVSESKAMHERIQDSTLEIIEGAAHFSNVEQSGAFNRSLSAFLAQH